MTLSPGHRDRTEVIVDFGLDKKETDTPISQLLSVFAKHLGYPVAFVTAVTDEEQIFKAKTGIELACSSRGDAFCSHVVDSGSPLIVEDAANNEVFASNHFVVNDPAIRCYVGVPLILESVVVGAVALVDYKPRVVTEETIDTLKSMSQFVSHYLHLVRAQAAMRNEHAILDKSQAVILRWRQVNGLSLCYVSSNVKRIFGISPEELVGDGSQFESILDGPSANELHFMLGNHIKGMEFCETRLKAANAGNQKFWIKLLSKADFDDENRVETINMMLVDDSRNKHVEEQLFETNRRMKLLLEASELGTWELNLPAGIKNVNARMCAMLGLDYEFFDTSINYWYMLIHPADKSLVEQELQKHLAGDSAELQVTYRMRHANGDWIWIETFGKVVERNPSGEPIRLAGAHRDITTRKQRELVETKQAQLLGFINKAQTAYLQHKDLAKACQQILPELIDIADSQFGFIGQLRKIDGNQALLIRAISELSWNQESAGLVESYQQGRLYFQNLDNLFGKVITSQETVLTNAPSKHSASRGTPPGHPRILRFLGIPIILGGEVLGMIGLANKFTDYETKDASFLQPLADALAGLFYAVDLEDDRKAMEERLKNMAMTDPLTGIPNRRAFLEFAETAKEYGDGFAIAIIDIDHFKSVNDTYGHAAGDKVIKAVANLITDALRPDDYLARIGGEEFALLAQTGGVSGARSLLEEVRKKIQNRSIVFENIEIKVTASFGACFVDNHSAHESQLQALLSVADQALYDSKAAGRNRVTWHSLDSSEA